MLQIKQRRFNMMKDQWKEKIRSPRDWVHKTRVSISVDRALLEGSKNTIVGHTNRSPVQDMPRRYWNAPFKCWCQWNNNVLG